jgi:hypothetical protein
VSTDDRLTLASVRNCGSAHALVRHDRWSSVAGVWVGPSVTLAYTREAEVALGQDAQDRPGQNMTEIVVSPVRVRHVPSCHPEFEAHTLDDTRPIRADELLTSCAQAQRPRQPTVLTAAAAVPL